MAKTINSEIDIFTKESTARKAFEKSTVPCQLLSAIFAGGKSYFIDRSKTAIIEWPNHYKLIQEK